MNRSLLLNQMSTHIFRYFYASPRPDKVQVEIQGLRCFWCIVNASASIPHEWMILLKVHRSKQTTCTHFQVFQAWCRKSRTCSHHPGCWQCRSPAKIESKFKSFFFVLLLSNLWWHHVMPCVWLWHICPARWWWWVACPAKMAKGPSRQVQFWEIVETAD